MKCSTDGKGCWRDNAFVERFWKTLKYEEVYLKAYDTLREARSITRYVAFMTHAGHIARSMADRPTRHTSAPRT